ASSSAGSGRAGAGRKSAREGASPQARSSSTARTETGERLLRVDFIHSRADRTSAAVPAVLQANARVVPRKGGRPHLQPCCWIATSYEATAPSLPPRTRVVTGQHPDHFRHSPQR